MPCGAPCSTSGSRTFCATILTAPWWRSAPGSTHASSGSIMAASTGSISTCRTQSNCGGSSSPIPGAARLWPRRFSIRTGLRRCVGAPGLTSSSQKRCFIYLQERQVKEALSQIARNFPGAGITFDTASRKALDSGNKDFVAQENGGALRVGLRRSARHRALEYRTAPGGIAHNGGRSGFFEGAPLVADANHLSRVSQTRSEAREGLPSQPFRRGSRASTKKCRDRI